MEQNSHGATVSDGTSSPGSLQGARQATGYRCSPSEVRSQGDWQPWERRGSRAAPGQPCSRAPRGHSMPGPDTPQRLPRNLLQGLTALCGPGITSCAAVNVSDRLWAQVLGQGWRPGARRHADPGECGRAPRVADRRRAGRA